MRQNRGLKLACRHLKTGQITFIAIQRSQRFGCGAIAQFYCQHIMTARLLHQTFHGKPVAGVQTQPGPVLRIKAFNRFLEFRRQALQCRFKPGLGAPVCPQQMPGKISQACALAPVRIEQRRFKHQLGTPQQPPCVAV